MTEQRRTDGKRRTEPPVGRPGPNRLTVLLVWLSHLPTTGVFLGALVLGLLGVFAPGVIGALLLSAIAAGLAALLAAGWPAHPPAGRALRLLVIALLVLIAVDKLN